MVWMDTHGMHGGSFEFVFHEYLPEGGFSETFLNSFLQMAEAAWISHTSSTWSIRLSGVKKRDQLGNLHQKWMQWEHYINMVNFSQKFCLLSHFIYRKYGS